jgi:alpha-beta hydrolase superfamily lysophospholipase
MRMYFTTKWAFASDLVEAVRFVKAKEGRDVVLVAHSSGAATTQLALSEGMGDLRVKALVLMGALPAFGS